MNSTLPGGKSKTRSTIASSALSGRSTTISRRPAVVTATAIAAATETIRPPGRTLGHGSIYDFEARDLNPRPSDSGPGFLRNRLEPYARTGG